MCLDTEKKSITRETIGFYYFIAAIRANTISDPKNGVSCKTRFVNKLKLFWEVFTSTL